MHASTLFALLPAFVAAAPANYCPGPSTPPPPPPSAPESCGGLHPTWTLEPVNLSAYYEYTSPSHAAGHQGSISFTFKSSQTDYLLECKGASTNPLGGQFYGYQWFDCAIPEGETWKKTSFSYDTASKTLAVNSTWTCGGDVVYNTGSSGTLDLKCDTETWVNPDWQSGEKYSTITTTCEPGKLVLQL